MMPGTEWTKVQKKPVVVEARVATEHTEVHTREGTVVAEPGDVLIRGVEGEVYPCDPGVFERTYRVLEGDHRSEPEQRRHLAAMSMAAAGAIQAHDHGAIDDAKAQLNTARNHRTNYLWGALDVPDLEGEP